MRRLVLRAASGDGVGTGHLARCLALAQAWIDAGGLAALDSPGAPVHWRDRYLAEGVATIDGAAGAPTSDDWVVFDGYGFPPQGAVRARQAGAHVLIVDDHGH